MPVLPLSPPPPIEHLNKKQSKTPRSQGLVEPIPIHPVYHFVLHSSTAVSERLPPAPPPHPVWPRLAFSAAWRSRLHCASSLCHLAMKQSTASTSPKHHFPLFLDALGRKTVSTPSSKGELSVNLSVACELGGRLLDIGHSYFPAGLVLGSPHQPSSQTSPYGPAPHWSPHVC